MNRENLLKTVEDNKVDLQDRFTNAMTGLTYLKMSSQALLAEKEEIGIYGENTVCGFGYFFDYAQGEMEDVFNIQSASIDLLKEYVPDSVHRIQVFQNTCTFCPRGYKDFGFFKTLKDDDFSFFCADRECPFSEKVGQAVVTEEMKAAFIENAQEQSLQVFER